MSHPTIETAKRIFREIVCRLKGRHPKRTVTGKWFKDGQHLQVYECWRCKKIWSEIIT